jgi:hypothetical protein
VLTEAIADFQKHVFPITHTIELEYVERETFMQGVKSDPLIQLQIKSGLYKNIEKEYPNFLVVYHKNKNPMLKLLELPFKISVCIDLAKDILKPYSKLEVRAYLKHMFVHEITHLFEDDFIKDKPMVWSNYLEEANGDTFIAKEFLAEYVASLVSDEKAYQKVFNEIWSVINQRIKKYESKLVR